MTLMSGSRGKEHEGELVDYVQTPLERLRIERSYNEDYVSALVHFENGTRGMLESCRVINGAKCDMSFEVHGTKGAIKWNMERMNELQLQWRNDANPAEDGYITLLSGPAHPYHRHFNPSWGLNLR